MYKFVYIKREASGAICSNSQKQKVEQEKNCEPRKAVVGLRKAVAAICLPHTVCADSLSKTLCKVIQMSMRRATLTRFVHSHSQKLFVKLLN